MIQAVNIVNLFIQTEALQSFKILHQLQNCGPKFFLHEKKKKCEFCTIEVAKCKLAIEYLYKSSNGDTNNFLFNLDTLFPYTYHKYNNNIIVGDSNIDFRKSSIPLEDLVRFLRFDYYNKPKYQKLFISNLCINNIIFYIIFQIDKFVLMLQIRVFEFTRVSILTSSLVKLLYQIVINFCHAFQ